MLQKTAQIISQQMVCCGVIPSDRKHIYEYGFELLLSSVLGLLSVILICIISQRAFLWIPYMLGFVPLRLFGGGYHAKTHSGCIFSFSIIFSLFLLLGIYCTSLSFFPIIALIISFFVIIVFAPVETISKPLKEKRRIKNRRISIALCIGNLIIAILSFIFSKSGNIVVFMYFAGITAASASALLAVKINHTKRRGEDNEAKG